MSLYYSPASQLFWYRVIFMIELIVAEAIFVYRCRRRSYFPLRVVISVTAALRIAFLIPIIDGSAAYCSFMFMLMYVVTVLLLKFCFAESFKNLIFCTMAGYAIQHISFQLYNFVSIAFEFDAGMNIYTGGGLPAFLENFTLFSVFFGSHLFFYFSAYFVFARRLRSGQGIELKNLTLLVILVLVIMTNIVFSSIVTYYGYSPFNFVTVIMLCVYDILSCVLTLFIQFELLLRREITYNLSAEQRLRRMEKEQYQMTKESIHQINVKCHDLKHQIRKIGSNDSVDSAELKKIEDMIWIYDSTYKTGNDALDIVLMEKMLACNKTGVRLTCMADPGQLLNLRDFDLYAFFGNAIDNALESASSLPENQRVVDITVKSVGNMTIVNIRNYYSGELTFEDGLPTTTKTNKDYHGFGMKSIREIVEKYNGELCIDAHDGVFDLSVLFANDF